METGTVLDEGVADQEHLEENIDRVGKLSACSPRKSIRAATRQLEPLRSTVHKVLQNLDNHCLL